MKLTTLKKANELQELIEQDKRALLCAREEEEDHKIIIELKHETKDFSTRFALDEDMVKKIRIFVADQLRERITKLEKEFNAL